jgi:NADH dehydrogenase
MPQPSTAPRPVTSLRSAKRKEILVIGGGYVGMYTALRLQRRLRPGEASITVVDGKSYMTYQPFLPEAAAGSLEPRHVVISLRKVLRKCTVITGQVARLDVAHRTAHIVPVEGPAYDHRFDLVVVAPGSVARTLPIPGLAEIAIGFKSISEAIYLRNTVIERLDAASSMTETAQKRKALTFVFIGGGYAGIEALAELEDMARDATTYYDGIEPSDLRFVLVEAADRILPEVSAGLGRYTVDRLVERGIDVRLQTRVESLQDNHVVLDDGTSFDAETVVWTAGVRPHPMLAETDLPLDDKGRVVATAYLQAENMPEVWVAGDCAAVPDLTGPPGAVCGPSAQHAVRQAKTLADNIVATLRGEPVTEYKHAYAGSVASLGLHKGVAEVYGIRLKGWPAWLMHRTYHLSRVPTTNRKARVVMDWTLALFFKREVVSLGQFQNPRDEFQTAATPAPVTTSVSDGNLLGMREAPTRD